MAESNHSIGSPDPVAGLLNCRGVARPLRSYDGSNSRVLCTKSQVAAIEPLRQSGTTESVVNLVSTPSETPGTEYEDWISRSETVDDIASASAMRGLQSILELPNQDEQQLSSLGHWLQFTPTVGLSELGEDGHPKLGGFLPPFPYPRRMWVGSRIEYHAPIPVGERITKTTIIKSITPKQGRGGGLIFLGQVGS